VDYQFPGTKKYPQIWIKTEDEADEKTVAERDEKRANAVAASGARLTPVYFKRRYNLAGDEIETTPQPPPESGGGARQGAGGGISLAEPGDDPAATMSALTDRLGKAAAPQPDDWIDALKKRIDAAESIEELPEIILAAYPDMSVEALAGIVAEETMRAFMAGRIDAENGE
jgi:hypothetical protein